jgi:N-acetylmuramoyl-L-alanine amidase
MAMRKVTKFFWMVGLSVQATLACAASSQIEGLSYSGQANGRLVFDLNAIPHYRFSVLKNPNRLVIDFKDTIAAQAIQQPPENHALAVGVRSAMRNDKDLRVVVELSAPVEAKALTTGNQLQIELTAAQAIEATPAPVAKKNKTEQLVATIAPKFAKPQAKPEAKPEPKPANKHVQAKGRNIIIAIDAGHGGKDVGAQGSNGTEEKDVVLAIAKRLESAVNRQAGMKAVMIRNGDYFVKLRERVRIAQAAQADLFVSIHADAFDDTSAHGASVYTLANKGASSQMAQFLAKSENASDASGAEADVHNEALNSILQDLSRNASKEASQHIGNKVLKSVKSVGHLHTPNVQKAGFVVLKSPIPSILVEAAFISNPEEERRLNTRAYQDQMATAVFGGILAHFKQYAPANTLFAQLQKSGRSATKVAAVEKSVEPVENKVVVAKLEKPAVSNSRDTKHVISNGETLSDIAQQYGVSMREIRMVNGMNDGNVKIGQVLQIPRSS